MNTWGFFDLPSLQEQHIVGSSVPATDKYRLPGNSLWRHRWPVISQSTQSPLRLRTNSGGRFVYCNFLHISLQKSAHTIKSTYCLSSLIRYEILITVPHTVLNNMTSYHMVVFIFPILSNYMHFATVTVFAHFSLCQRDQSTPPYSLMQ